MTSSEDVRGQLSSARDELLRARDRTLELLEPLNEADLVHSATPHMSPLVWDLAHVGNYEELWILQRLAGLPPTNELYDDMYDAFRHERFVRDELPLLRGNEARSYIAAVRERTLETLATLDPESIPDAGALLQDGFIIGMVVQHEHQHDETILQSRQLLGERAMPIATTGDRVLPSTPSCASAGAELLVEGGSFQLGTSAEPWAYDNERPAHTATLDDFWIDVHPVTNGQFLGFMEQGGYDTREAWSDDGWAWRSIEGTRAPQFWQRDAGGSWVVRRFGDLRPLDLDEPVQHVSWFEADAFARWCGRRLPTETEWERAASWDESGIHRRVPWGGDEPDAAHANVGQRHDGPLPIGSLPQGASALGCQQMLGDVWEWTSSEFDGYPGFRSFPYREYSEVFFGRGYRVLRGGSWATHPRAIRTTFRNWDLPQRRQLFAGLRTARNAT